MKSKVEMERNERWEVNHKGELCIAIPADTRKIDNKKMLENMLTQNGWECNIEENSGCYYKVKIHNDRINESKVLNIYFANIRKEDPERNREEKKIQLGNGIDPRSNIQNPTIILGIYVYNENDNLNESIIVAWPVENEKNYTKNPSLRVNMKNNIQKAKINGIHIDSTTGKKLVSFRPEFIFYYIENYSNLHNNNLETEQKNQVDNEEINLIEKPHNRILFGAPGTGKSYIIDKDKKVFGNNYERVTFHPNYSYAQFVGSYKPIAKERNIIKDGENQNEEFISYEFVAGPFTRTLIKALNNDKSNYLIIIEEINRANPASVFGDIFQLLDRDDSGKSKYTINISEEMKKYIRENLTDENIINKINDNGLYIPRNMYIWTTMNSADQGVYPMDSAFKRRWSFEYIDINAGEKSLKNSKFNKIKIKSGENDYSEYDWNEIRKKINYQLKNSSIKINEDKLLGPYFLSELELSLSQDEKTQKQFDDVFKSKLLMYLYEDVLKHKKSDVLFSGNINSLSDLVESYDKGRIFKFDISSCKYEKKLDISNFEYNSIADNISQYDEVSDDQKVDISENLNLDISANVN